MHDAGADTMPAVSSAVSTPSKISVLFVCLGNICRSPMAEAIFRSQASSHPRISRIDSAATSNYNTGYEPDSRTIGVLSNHGITDYKHAARQVKASDFSTFDYILCMDQYNLSDLQRMRRSAEKKSGEVVRARVMLFGDWGGHEGEQVGDPYYGAVDGFEECYEQLQRFSKGLVEKVLDSPSERTP